MISSSRSRLSYKDRRSHQKQRFRFVGVIALVLVVYLVFTILVASPWLLETNSMAPGYGEGTRILVKPYLIRDSEGRLKNPPRRGDIISIQPPYIPELSWQLKLFNPIVRLFTAQRINIGYASREAWENERIFKRIVAVPGDSIRIEDSVAYIKKSGDDFFISEFEQSGLGYDLEVQSIPEKWSEDLPLAASSDVVVLGDNQFYVLGDNRQDSNDSRYWGPIDDTAIRGRAIWTYWPLRSFGKLR